MHWLITSTPLTTPLYQVSTSTALVEGIYQGAVRVGKLRQHGDFGLGTFENLNGEIAILDGHVYQIRGDGSVQEAGDEELSPFAAITTFVPDTRGEIEDCPAYANLLQVFDGMRRLGEHLLRTPRGWALRHNAHARRMQDDGGRPACPSSSSAAGVPLRKRLWHAGRVLDP